MALWSRSCSLAALACVVALGAPVASGASDGSAARNTYDYAIRCFAVTPFARKAGYPDADGEKAFRVAYAIGPKLGYTPEQVGADVKARSKIELAKMHRDAAYVRKVLDDCKFLKLL